MYLIYETYTDETRNMKQLRFNTKIIGIYQDKKNAKNKLKEYVNSIINNINDDFNWYAKKFNKKIIKDEFKNIIDIYEIYNDFIENCEEIYYVVLEEVEVFKDETNN